MASKEIETTLQQPLSLDQRKRILEKLNEGVIFEKFLHTKYIGQKRFSLEGGETTIAALDAMLTVAADYGVKEAVIGMAHEGKTECARKHSWKKPTNKSLANLKGQPFPIRQWEVVM